MYKALSSWRGLIVVVIILYHTPVAGLDEIGHLGVSMCLVMSGALLAMRHPRVDVSWWQWMKPRASRLYGIHWLMLALLVAMMAGRGAFKPDLTLLANALLLHAWMPVREVYLSYNKPTWFLSVLLTCYALYPLLSQWLGRLSLRGKWIVAAILLVINVAVMGDVSQDVRDWLQDTPLMRLGDFVWGMALGASMPAIERAVGNSVRRHATAVELTVIALIAALCLAVKAMPWLDCCEDIAAWWIPGSIFIAMCVILNGNEGIVGRIMRSRPMTWLGSISLEAYMLQAIVTYAYAHYLSGAAAHFGHPEFYDISWPITLPLTLLLATILHHTIFKRKRN